MIESVYLQTDQYSRNCCSKAWRRSDSWLAACCLRLHNGSGRDDPRYKCTVNRRENLLPPTYNHVVIIKTKSTCGNRSSSLPRDNASHSNYFPPADLPTSESLFIGSLRSSRSPNIRIRHLTSRTFLFSSNRRFVIKHTLFPLLYGNYPTTRCITQKSILTAYN